MFYLCKVLSCHNTAEQLTDHSILEVMRFVKVHDLEELKKKRGIVYSKLLLEKEIYVLPKQIFYPDVTVSENLKLSSKDYQFLSDCV